MERNCVVRVSQVKSCEGKLESYLPATIGLHTVYAVGKILTLTRLDETVTVGQADCFKGMAEPREIAIEFSRMRG